MHMNPFTLDSYIEEYIEDEDFKEVFQQLHGQFYVEESDNKADYHLWYGLVYNIHKVYTPKFECLHLIKEVDTSKFVGNFDFGKKVTNLQSYVYSPKMLEDVARFIVVCILCCIGNPNDRKQGLYNPLHEPTRLWENISMDFVGGLPRAMKERDCRLW